MWYASPLAPCGTANGTVALPAFLSASASTDTASNVLGWVLMRLAFVIMATFSICVGMP